MTTVRLGTRNSPLAMWQARRVKSLIQARNSTIRVEIVEIVTTGDRNRTDAISRIGTTAVFTREIETALQEHRCDIGVHSLKDVGTQLPSGLVCDVFLPREDPSDAFVSANYDSVKSLPDNAIVGTSSLRRRAEILHRFPQLRMTNYRGNVHTRLKKAGVDPGNDTDTQPPTVDGTILAFAGLKRLGLDHLVSEKLAPSIFLPAPAQGVIGLEMRADDTATRTIAAPLNHHATERATVAERTFLRVMEGGCQLPLGAYAIVDGENITLNGAVYSLDGQTRLHGELRGQDPWSTGEALAEQIIADGGKQILDDIKRELQNDQ